MVCVVVHSLYQITVIRNQQVVGSSPISSSKKAPLEEEPFLCPAKRRCGWRCFGQSFQASWKRNAEGFCHGTDRSAFIFLFCPGTQYKSCARRGNLFGRKQQEETSSRRLYRKMAAGGQNVVQLRERSTFWGNNTTFF